MPANKNALLRYKTIDSCLRRTYRKWTLEDLVEACSQALYEYEGTASVSRRTVQLDLQMMRSSRLYEAPIEVYEKKYYRYSDPDFTITNKPLSSSDVEVMAEAVEMLRQYEGFAHFEGMSDLVGRLRDTVDTARNSSRHPVVGFEHNNRVKGLDLINPLYNYIEHRVTLKVMYKSFTARQAQRYIVFPHMLKEYRNRWFLFCSRASDMSVYNFALDRFESIETVDDIEYKDNPKFNPATYFENIIGVTRVSRAVTVRLWASKNRAMYIDTKPIHKSQRTVTVLPDNSMEFEMFVEPNKEFYAELLSLWTRCEGIVASQRGKEMKSKLAQASSLYSAHNL